MTPQERKNFESIRDNVHGEPMTQVEAMKLARQLLWRYRHETPIGNQPYMICQEVDEAFEKIDQAIEQAQHKLKPRCFADFQPNHEIDRKCQWCAVQTECQSIEQAQKQERNFCERCGKRLVDGHIHTCTPPAEQAQEPVAVVADVHMSRYTIEWTNGPLPEGTQLYTFPPQQKQEPVAEMMKNPSDGHLYVQYTKPFHLIGAGAKFYTSPPQRQPLVIDSQEKASEYIEKTLWEVIDVAAMFPKAKPDPRTWEHLMAYAPQRQWVMPTRNELLEIVNEFYKQNASEREIAFARLVIAKLKEKNT